MIYLNLILLNILFSVVNCRIPGLKARISETGLKYANDVAIDQLSKSVHGQRIPDQSGRSGDVSYDITYIIIQSFSKPQSSIDVVSDGLSWSATGLGLSISGHFHYKLHKIIPISDSGDIDVSVSGVNFKVGISIGEDSTGRPKLGSTGCTCSIGSVNVKFHGGAAWIYNLFKGFVEDALKKQLNGQLCDIVKKAVDDDANKSLEKLKVTVDIDKVFMLDYRFTGRPAFNPQHFLETYHKGEVYWTNNVKEAPFEPTPMPAVSDTQKMLYIWMSTYVFNTMVYQAQTHGMLVYNLTQNDLPKADRDFLNTTCVGSPCIGSVIPQIAQKYPNRHVQMLMSSDVTPKMSAANGKVNVECGGKITMVTQKDGIFLVSIHATMEAGVSLNVQDEKIYGKVDDLSIKLQVVKSDVGPISDAILNIIAETAVIAFVKPQLNKLGAKGIPLPLTDKVHLVNTQITLDKDTLIIGTDLKYQ